MSITKRFAEQQEEDENRNNAIEAMIKSDMLNGAALGIAKKVFTEKSIGNLSTAQLEVYDRHIKPHFKQHCQGDDCENELPFDRAAEAIRSLNGMESETVCDECSYKEYQRSKDD